MKKRAQAMGIAVKKSEVLRAALATFHELTDARVAEALRKLEAIKEKGAAKLRK